MNGKEKSKKRQEKPEIQETEEKDSNTRHTRTSRVQLEIYDNLFSFYARWEKRGKKTKENWNLMAHNATLPKAPSNLRLSYLNIDCVFIFFLITITILCLFYIYFFT